jgi:hypothetical protein
VSFVPDTDIEHLPVRIVVGRLDLVERLPLLLRDGTVDDVGNFPATIPPPEEREIVWGLV